MIDFPMLLRVANNALARPSEDAIETFMQYVNSLDEPDGILEQAMLEVVSDVTLHEYLCHERTE